ncbi:hypothetical protein PQ455_07420 [Sphingomonas naphthae]|uniref:Uncharacterized protein n=1 Tax=Sphingomonas naphthae TaxID=1813468 RepID=A0ABY7TP84_9SPHN|nr:hypothetical protein [Sphingomonas naphthae]WCT75035.1 hypothetical protein PQ455_07420 [Sphingomonas naphthae]
MKRHAVALRAFTHADDSFQAGQTILNMEPTRFTDWSAPGVDLVREATEAEVAKAKGGKPTTANAPRTMPTTKRPAKKAAPAPAPVAELAPLPIPEGDATL